METALREFHRLQTGPEIPPFPHESIPTGLLLQADICTVCVAGRGGCKSELRTIRHNACHRSGVGTVSISTSNSPLLRLTTATIRRMKVSGEQFEDRIVEVHWDPTLEGWRMMRFRDDKPAGNHINTVVSVIQSIRDGVEKETVRVTQYPQNGLILTSSSPSSSRNVVSFERPGRLDIVSRTNHLPTPAERHQIFPPLSPNRDPCPLLILNLHTRTLIPTYRRGIRSSNSSNLSRTLKQACKVMSHRHHQRQVLDLHYRMGRLGTDRCKRQSGVG